VRKLISLGAACEVAFQLRQHSGDSTAHYFDWLITPGDGLLYILENDFPPFRRENLLLRNAGDRKGAVTDTLSRVVFHHQFPRHGKTIAADFLAAYDGFAMKFEHLAARFRATVQTHPVAFVRRNMSLPRALQVESAMLRLFPDGDLFFLYVNDRPGTFETPLGHSVCLPANTTGFGDSIAWAQLLAREGLVEKPYRLAISQILRPGADGNWPGDRRAQSLAILAAARRANPQNPWFSYELGWRAFQTRRLRRAARLAEDALAHDSANVDFAELSLRARLALHRVRREDALGEAHALLDRDFRPALCELGSDLAVALGRPAEALAMLDHGLQRRPEADGLLLRKARLLLLSGKLSEASEAADAALALHPAGKAYIELKAKILCAIGRPEEAYALLGDTLRRKRSFRLQIVRAVLAVRLLGRVVRRSSRVRDGGRLSLP